MFTELLEHLGPALNASGIPYMFLFEYGADYWLYVVEHAGDEGAPIVRIQGSRWQSASFTFDHGWINVAELDGTADVASK